MQPQPARAGPAREARASATAGGTPMEFNTISVSDGVSMGTEGMRASLVSREVIADSIELVARGHLFDGLVCLVGCDKTIPAAVMALGAARHPRRSSSTTARSRPARFRGKDVTIAGRVRGDRRLRGRQDERRGRCTSSSTSPARAPAPAAASSPPTRCRRSLEFLGLSPAGPERHPGARADARTRPPTRPAGSRWTSCCAGPPPEQDRHARGARERGRLGRRDRRLDERRPAPARDRARVRHPVRRSTTSTRSRRARRSSPT